MCGFEWHAAEGLFGTDPKNLDGGGQILEIQAVEPVEFPEEADGSAAQATFRVEIADIAPHGGWYGSHKGRKVQRCFGLWESD